MTNLSFNGERLPYSLRALSLSDQIPQGFEGLKNISTYQIDKDKDQKNMTV